MRPPPSPRSELLELPSSHRLPLSWLLEAASPPIQYRALAEAAPESARDPERLAALRTAAAGWKMAHAIARKQKDTGIWGGSLFAPGPNRAYGWKEAGTVFQYRRLLEMGWSAEERCFRIADRFLFRLLSRDEDPALLMEFQRPAKADHALGRWARQMGREAAAAALARAGRVDDPRLRGTAHRVASDISQYLRSELAQKPFKKASGKPVLDPLGYPPTIFAVEMLAFLPTVQRERAGFLERLGHFFSAAASRRAFFIQAGKRFLPPLFEVLGDPLRADAQGRVTDIPFAVYWLELLARLGLVRQIPSASRVLARLLSECDEHGIWSPKALRALPKSAHPVIAHYFPIEGPGKSPAQRQTDVTFRLGLIARIMGIPIEAI
ncbi:MAG: hypothetical protein HYS40_08050 [Gemmatimonadetes bacterium]|nr:hypothetical protein [Gemmatimonadota bacterium]